PLQALATELTRESESVTAAATLMDDLMQDPRSLMLYLGRQNPKRHTLLVLDQFEELFTLCRDEFEREAFIDNLLTTLNQGEGNSTLILTLRADFYAHLAQYPELRDAVAKHQEYIGPMTADELRRAIEEPAKRGHWAFEPGLVDLILRDIGDEPGALPLLSHALLETWKRRAGHTLTLKGYADAGGVHGAIAHTAESVYQNLSLDEQAIARDIFLRLTELGKGTEDTRRRASFGELMSDAENAGEVRRTLNYLAEARLITLGEDIAEVAHEALIREWPTLREWLNQDREGLQLHRHLTETAHEWELLERDPGALYRGAHLAQAHEWAALHPNALNVGEKAFLEASNALEQSEIAEREAQRQRELESAQKLAKSEQRANTQLRKRALYLAGAFIVTLLMALTALFFGERARQNALDAQATSRVATSRELAAAAISNLNEDPERSVLLALQAESTVDTLEAENALHRSILASRVELVLHHEAQVWSVTFSPDGKRVATASQDQTAKVWDAATGQLLLTLIGHTDSVNGIVYSPDGKRIATTSDDSSAKVWDAATGKLLLTLAGHTKWVYRIAFSPDETRLVTTSGDDTAKVWDANTGRELLTFSAHQDEVMDVAFSPDGKRVATCGMDRNVRVWDPTSGKELLALPFDAGVWNCSVAYSPDGKRIAEASDGVHFANVWDATTGEVLLNGSFGHSDWLRDIAFSFDGKLTATGGADHKVNVWDTTTGQVLYTLSGHTNGINGVAFSPDGTRLASASWDRTARVWDITPAKESLFIPIDPSWSWNVRYSPDGTRLLTDYQAENIIKEWDAVSGKEILTFTGPANQPIYNIAYSPNGKLVAGSSEQSITVWDVQTGKQRAILAGHTYYSSIAFSSDGAHLASGSGTLTGGSESNDVGKVIIWDLASGKPLFILQASDTEILSVAYSPDGNYLISADRAGDAVIWNAATGEKISTLSGNGENRNTAYSPDGKHVALSVLGGTINVWDVSTEKLLWTLKGHTGAVNSVAFSPDSKLLASASGDGTARVWNVATGETLLTLPVDSGGAGSISFSPDGKRLAVGGKLGVYVFVLPIDDVVALAKSRVTRSLTAEECQQYLHIEQCPSEH
ncbi:MAG TPA: WD40 repeat domain-containing protein, partial [Anaerolineales bacterium]|nr:WD40 repeat domain-containing protein [Anaerolineales bacterium]